MSEAKKGRVQNLQPVKTKEEARSRGHNGGIKSGEAKRKKKLMSEIYAEVLAEKAKIDINGDGKLKELTGENLIKEVARRILVSGGSPAVSLIKEIREGTEGSKVVLDGELKTTALDTPEARKEAFDKLMGKT